MKVGKWSDICWERCIGIALLIWVILYASIWFFGGIIDHYTDWLVWLYD